MPSSKRRSVLPPVIRHLDIASDTDREALYDLRWRLLRAPHGMPRGSERLAGDDAPSSTVHIGAFTPDGRLVGCASLMEKEGLQLRAMAVDPEMQGQGVGAAILREAADVADARESELWCQARAHAVGFYARSGWQVEGDVFDVPGIGPHYVMRRRKIPGEDRRGEKNY